MTIDWCPWTCKTRHASRIRRLLLGFAIIEKSSVNLYDWILCFSQTIKYYTTQQICIPVCVLHPCSLYSYIEPYTKVSVCSILVYRYKASGVQWLSTHFFLLLCSTNHDALNANRFHSSRPYDGAVHNQEIQEFLLLSFIPRQCTDNCRAQQSFRIMKQSNKGTMMGAIQFSFSRPATCQH